MTRTMTAAVFLASLGVAMGCAVSDYAVIIDNDQSRAGGNNRGGIVDTRGKAKIYNKMQLAIFWPDGTDEFIHFVDQRSDGTATLTTYNNHSTGSEPTFHANQYCDTAWSGCSIFTAPDDNDGNLFDGRTNPNCSGARSLSFVLSTGRYYGECGRGRARLGVEEKLALLDGAVGAAAFGRAGLLWKLNATNTRIRARNLETGRVFGVPTHGAVVEYLMLNGGRGRALVWLDHAMLATAMRGFAGLLDGGLQGEEVEMTVSYNGIDSRFRIAGGAHPDVNAGAWRRRANSSF